MGGSDPNDRAVAAKPGAATLPEALERCGHQLSAEQTAVLEHYCQLLWEWNAKINLTRHTTFELFAARDVTDALELSRLVRPGEQLLDVGAGGGAIGVILAAVRPDVDVALCDSVGKKARALEAMVVELGLPAAVHHARAEELVEDFRFDVLTARAVGPLWRICRWMAPHWDAFGRLLVVKGPKWVEERKAARERGLLRQVELRRAAEYVVPGSGARSVILKLWKKGRPEP